MTDASNTSKSIHLSASAGSGKTRALTERYLALLDALDHRGLNIDQAVAITFTDKAAAEIKERVMHDLPESILKKIIRGRQDMRISTIHSFCMNLLKRYPLEAGLPPDFGVLDARDQTYMILKSIEDALEESDRDPAMSPLRHLAAERLIAVIEFLLSIRSKLKRIEIDAGGPDQLLAKLRSGMDSDRFKEELRALIAGGEWRSSFREMERVLQSQGEYYDTCMAKEHAQLSAITDTDSALKMVGPLARIYFNKDGSRCKKVHIPKGDFKGRNRDAYETLFFQIQSNLEQCISLHARMLAGRKAESMLTLFQIAEKKYQDLKLAEGLLDFDDLEIYAYGLLQNVQSPDILYWLDRKILHFLVDEFQDTSDIQWSVLNKLTEEIFAGQGADKPMSPTLFIVGDEKQSIYRFREANYRLIRSVKKKIEGLPAGSREILTLDRNFRSTPEIIRIANSLFGRLWGEVYKPSEVERKEHKGSVRLIEIAPGKSGQQPQPPGEALVLAQTIKSLITNGTIVYEKTLNSGPGARPGGGWTTRKAGYADCAVLIQSRTKLKEYEAALQGESVPYRVIGGIGFYEEDEIQALMNVLFFLWNRDEDLALAAALKSPLFGLDDREIFNLVQDSGLIDGLRRQRPGEWKLLQGWMDRAGLLPLADLIHTVVQDSCAYVRYGSLNPQSVFNIDKLLDTARAFDRRGYTTLQDFVEWVKNVRQTEQREATADMNLPGFHGAVSIMTVHKAKGLEYPIVFLPGMNQGLKSLSTGPLAVVEESGGNLHMAFNEDNENPVYNELWEQERLELLGEHQRLLYVAMTRARDHLIMIGTLDGNTAAVKKNSWLSYLHEAAPGPLFGSSVGSGPGLLVYSHAAGSEAGDLSRQPRSVVEEKFSHDEGKAGAAGMSAERIDMKIVLDNLSPVPRSESGEWKKATDYIRDEEPIEKLAIQAGASVVSPLSRGSLLHRCLEDLTKKGRYDVHRTVREYPDIAALKKEDLEKFIHDAETVMHAVLNKPGHAWIFESTPHAYSELPFLYKKGHSLVSGVIDRVVIKEGKGYVIDYKSILIEDDGALASWLDHYRPQLQIYCEAVKAMFSLPHVDGYLLFLDSNRLELCLSI